MTTQLPEHPDPVTRACALHDDAIAWYTAGEHQHAVALFRRALRGLKRAAGPQVVTCQENYAAVRRQARAARIARAVPPAAAPRQRVVTSLQAAESERNL